MNMYSSSYDLIKHPDEIRSVDHPLFVTFCKWCDQQRTNTTTKAARKFLEKYPQYTVDSRPE